MHQTNAFETNGQVAPAARIAEVVGHQFFPKILALLVATERLVSTVGFLVQVAKVVQGSGQASLKISDEGVSRDELSPNLACLVVGGEGLLGMIGIVLERTQTMIRIGTGFQELRVRGLLDGQRIDDVAGTRLP
jgi:hypothetical protein